MRIHSITHCTRKPAKYYTLDEKTRKVLHIGRETPQSITHCTRNPAKYYTLYEKTRKVLHHTNRTTPCTSNMFLYCLDRLMVTLLLKLYKL